MKWLAALLLLASTASAQTMATGGPSAPVLVGKQSTNRDTYVCLIPDTQNLVNAIDFAVPNFDNTCAVCPGNANGGWYGGTAADPDYSIVGQCGTAEIPPWCQGSDCVASPYCAGTWTNTNFRLFMALAYDLTGQWQKANDLFIGIGEQDKAIRTLIGAEDHPRCDLIVSLGDMVDLGGEAGDDTSTLSQLDSDAHRQIEMNKSFWRVIKASGIPYIFLQGNHDPGAMMPDLFDALSFGTESFYYNSVDSNRRGNSILARTPLGRVCVVGVPWNNTAGAIGAWGIATTGCGGGFPTILAQHTAIDNETTCNAGGSSTVTSILASGESTVFMVVGGHLSTNSSCKAAKSSPGAVDYIAMYSDWQETNRHNPGYSTQYNPRGVTPSDSGGIYYTVVRIAPDSSRITAWDWSPYWHTRAAQADGSMTVSTYNAAFDWDARGFPQ